LFCSARWVEKAGTVFTGPTFIVHVGLVGEKKEKRKRFILSVKFNGV